MRQLASFFVRKVTKNNIFFKSCLHQLIEQEAWPQNELLDKQNELLINLIHRAYHYSSFYKSLYDKYEVNIESIKDTRDISKLPILNKDDIKNNIDKIWIGSKLFARKGYTSGTSGSPLIVYRNYSSIIKEEAYIWRQRMNFGHKMGMKAVSLRGDLDRDQFKVFDPFTNTLYLSSFMLNNKNVEKYYNVISKFNPNAVYAYPSSVEILANFLIHKSKSLHIPFIFTSSETLYDFQREKIEKAFGARIVDWYGNAERTIALEENKNGTYNELPLYSFNEYFEDYTVTTGLINFSFPLIRYKVDDIIELNSEPGVIKKIFGRTDDVIYLADGTQIGRLGGVFKGLDEIQFAQIVQNEIDCLYINVVPGRAFSKEVLEHIDRNMRRRVGNEVSIKYQTIQEESLIKTKRGKYRLVINNLDDTQKKAQVLS